MVGYCLGGLLAFLSGCQLDIDAAIGYYGVGIENNLENKNMIRKPIMLHFAENDGFVPPETRKGLEESFSGNDLVTINNYPGCDHGFARTGGGNYDKAAAEISDTRTLALLKQSLA